MDYFIIPSARSLNFDTYFIDKYLVDMNFFNSKDLMSMVTVYSAGLIIYIAVIKFNLFHFHLPKQLDFESEYYTPIYEKSGKFLTRILSVTEKYINRSDVFIYGFMLLLLILLLLNFL